MAWSVQPQLSVYSLDKLRQITNRDDLDSAVSEDVL
jgi:hypothetical protein